MKQIAYTTRRGFTIVEIVMAVIIISVLTAILTPTLTNRGREAKEKAAMQDLMSLANAQERAAIDTGFFYRIYALDDVPGKGDARPSAYETQPSTPDQDDKIDAVGDEGVTDNNLYEKPSNLFISVKGIPGSTPGEMAGQNFVGNQDALFKRLVTNETTFGWQGPYVNWHNDINKNDWPDDPWGNDYMFFTQAGALYPPDRVSQFSENQQDQCYQNLASLGPKFIGGNGQMVQYKATLVFDRPTFLSLGPNGLPGAGSGDVNADGYGKGDDIIYQFGGR